MTNLKVREDVSLRVEQGSPLQGIGVLPQVGFIMLFAGDTAPNGWIFCEGQSIDSNQYPELFQILGSNIPNLKGRYLIGTTDSNLIGTSIGSNTHTHPFNYSVSLQNTGTTAHNSAAVASNWGNISTGHNHGWNYSFGTGTNSNSFSNVPINVTAGNQANVWNSTHGHSFSGAIGYNAATVNHSHGGNMGETTTTGNSHSHSLTTSSVNTESASSLPSTAYLKYIIKVG